MKVVCPVCGQEGVVEQRGNSVRIVHYSWVNGKRVFTKHTVKKGTWEQHLGTVKDFNSVFHENQRGCRLAWSRLGDLGSPDPGSNPGSPTFRLIPAVSIPSPFTKTVCSWLFCLFRACIRAYSPD